MASNKKDVWAIAFSDLHLARYKKYNEGNRRLDNAIDVIRRVEVIARTYGCIKLFLGDLYDKEKHITNALFADTLPYLGKVYKNDKHITYGISGNHDQSDANLIGKPSYSYVETLSKTFKGIECLDFKSKDFGDIEVYGVPYITHDLGLIGYIRKLKIDPSKMNVLLLHTTMPNVKETDGRAMHSHMPTNDFEEAIAKFDLVLSGHIHKPMEMKVGKTTVVQVGAPQHQRFTDRNCEMGYWIIYKNLDVKFIPFNKYPKFIELEPGETAPDNKNFYVETKVKKDKGITVIKRSKFNINSSGSKLARNYCREKKIVNKIKRKALKESLKKVI